MQLQEARQKIDGLGPVQLITTSSWQH